MSAIGTKRTSQIAPHMSAFGGKADLSQASSKTRGRLQGRGHPMSRAERKGRGKWRCRKVDVDDITRPKRKSAQILSLVGCRVRTALHAFISTILRIVSLLHAYKVPCAADRGVLDNPASYADRCLGWRDSNHTNASTCADARARV